ncbi:MAG: GNAT family N-acetyltransferase [Stellaceae bacterium]
MPAALAVEFVAGRDLDRLSDAWKELEPRCDSSFFLSWGWIGCWLRLVQDRRRLVGCVLRDDAGRAVGASLFGTARRLRRTFLPSFAYYLHEAGDPALDCLTIEYNGALAAADRLGEIAGATVAALSQRDRRWDELVLSGLEAAQCDAFEAAARAHGLVHRRLYDKPSYWVDLDALRAGSGYLEALSQNTRYQIRRALRSYQADGPVAFVTAQSPEEALAFLDGLKALHQAYWRARGKPGAFANPFFELFHRSLIAERLALGEIELAKVTVAGEPLGYLYNFIYRGRVYSYQSGFRYDADAKRKPGLVSHYLAIEHHVRAGSRVYDFLAGEAQHKKSLATNDLRLAWVAVQRDRLGFRLEESLRGLKRRWLHDHG